MTLRLCLLLLAAVSGWLPVRAQVVDDVLQHAPMAAVLAMKALDYDNGSTWPELVMTAGASYVAGTLTTYSLKQVVSERRPDGSDRRSFPSGHATYAFAGATMLHHEFGHVSPWVTVGGFGMAALVAADRVRHDRHYLHDVCAGAAIGVASTELSYWLKRRIIKSEKVDVTFTGRSLALAVCW